MVAARNTLYEYALKYNRKEAQLNFYRNDGSNYSDTKLIRFGARDYDPTIGRWTTKDPIGLAGGLNQYEYAASNPMSAIDPTGLYVDTFLDAAFIGYDLYRIQQDGFDNLGENLLALGADVASAMIPFVTGGGLAVRGGIKTLNHTADQAAVVALAKEGLEKGLTRSEAETLIKWANETKLPLKRGNPHRIDPPHVKIPYDHAHIGPIQHIRIRGN